MPAFKGTDAPADARSFAAQGLGSYASFDFSRGGILADGRKACASFSPAFATDPVLPRLAFFTCHHHLPRRDLFLQPDYLRHANGAKRGGEVIFLVRVRRLIEAFSRTRLRARPERCQAAYALVRQAIASFCCVKTTSPARVPRSIGWKRPISMWSSASFKEGDAPYRATEGSIVVAPEDAFGVALEFVTAGE
jgi:hypothetical protein